jgi:hypothetical protein
LLVRDVTGIAAIAVAGVLFVANALDIASVSDAVACPLCSLNFCCCSVMLMVSLLLMASLLLLTPLLPPASLLLLLFRDAHGKSAVNGVSSVPNNPTASSIPAAVTFP